MFNTQLTSGTKEGQFFRFPSHEVIGTSVTVRLVFGDVTSGQNGYECQWSTGGTQSTGDSVTVTGEVGGNNVLVDLVDGSYTAYVYYICKQGKHPVCIFLMHSQPSKYFIPPDLCFVLRNCAYGCCYWFAKSPTG